MALGNSVTQYGVITRSFHWLTALLILTAIPLGLIANNIPFDTDQDIARKTLLFSAHKTVGVMAFFVGLARILWALTQPHPNPLHPDRKLETFAASLVHWLLYISLVVVPLSGWLHHAATSGFAPIWWPFGQSLPFVPKNPELAEFFSSWHLVFTKVLAASVILHIAGALKHVVIDKDSTLARMVSGKEVQIDTVKSNHKSPLLFASAIWIAALGLGSYLGLQANHSQGELGLTTPVAGGWNVETGALSISVTQLGSPVSGEFADWTAAIEFDPNSSDPILGNVDVEIAISSISIGAVTEQALGPDYFDAAQFPTARYSGPITEDPAGDGYVVLGTLSLRGAELPLELPFSISMDGDSATATGATTIDRRPFGIGDNVSDEGSLGFNVEIDFNLTATRNE